MKRVAIFGSPGSGKSTLARQLSVLTSLPAVHLDSYYFCPGWVIRPADAFSASVTDIVAADCWITDGNYVSESIRTGRIDRADTLILLEYPRVVCLWRVIRRIRQTYGRVRIDQAAGCPERLDVDFLKFVWNYPQKTGQIRRILTDQSVTKRVVILRSNKAVNAFLATTQSVR